MVGAGKMSLASSNAASREFSSLREYVLRIEQSSRVDLVRSLLALANAQHILRIGLGRILSSE